MSEERRKTPRKRYLRRGDLVFTNGCSMMQCLVMDMHAGGAKLRVTDWKGLPDRVELRIDNGPTHVAEIRYRDMRNVGVQFIEDSVA